MKAINMSDIHDMSNSNYVVDKLDNAPDLKGEIRELKNKVGVLTGRIISFKRELYRERLSIKRLYQHLGLKLGDEYDDIEEDEEGEWLKI